MSGTKQYPTRMHEILGVEPMECFTHDGSREQYFVDHQGFVCSVSTGETACGGKVCHIVNHPERIIRRPRLTEEQVAHLNGLLLLGFRKIQKDYKKSLIAYGGSKVTEWTLPISTQDILLGLVIDPAPLDIVATLRDAGVTLTDPNQP